MSLSYFSRTSHKMYCFSLFSSARACIPGIACYRCSHIPSMHFANRFICKHKGGDDHEPFSCNYANVDHPSNLSHPRSCCDDLFGGRNEIKGGPGRNMESDYKCGLYCSYACLSVWILCNGSVCGPGGARLGIIKNIQMCSMLIKLTLEL